MATTARRICVTGATGKAGRAVVADLREHGYEVAGDRRRGSAATTCGRGVLRADLTDYGQATEALRGTDAVVHLANIPAPGLSTPAVTFNDNITMNFNIFHAAAALGLPGWCGRPARPRSACRSAAAPSRNRARRASLRYAPVDEDHFPSRSTTYALSKMASEAIAEQISRWSGIPFVGVAHLQHHGAARLPAFPVATGRTRTPASGTPGATSTSVMSPPPAVSAWRPTSRAARTSSSPPPTRS